MAQVKICGINDPDALTAAFEAGADWIGFVFFPASPRAVTPAQAAALVALQPNGPSRVGLFVAPSDDEIDAALAAVKLDALQLYADPTRVAALRERTGLPIWRAVGIRTGDDLPRTADGSDRLLIEAKAPPESSRPGGNAQTFDWTLLAGWQPPAPWMLAGGLNPGNVAAAIAATQAPAVDVSSGVERAPGQKDPALIRAFAAAAQYGER